MTKIKGFAIAKFLPLMRLTFLWLFFIQGENKDWSRKRKPSAMSKFLHFWQFS